MIHDIQNYMYVYIYIYNHMTVLIYTTTVFGFWLIYTYLYDTQTPKDGLRDWVAEAVNGLNQALQVRCVL